MMLSRRQSVLLDDVPRFFLLDGSGIFATDEGGKAILFSGRTVPFGKDLGIPLAGPRVGFGSPSTEGSAGLPVSLFDLRDSSVSTLFATGHGVRGLAFDEHGVAWVEDTVTDAHMAAPALFYLPL